MSVLTLRPRLEDVGRRLACRATNPLIQGAAVQDEITLKIDCEYLELKCNQHAVPFHYLGTVDAVFLFLVCGG